MTREELAQAIEKPANKVGLTFEPGLVERLLDDVGQEPGNLPLLEFALTNLWERRQGGQLLHQAYDDMGRVQGAVAQQAEELYQKLVPLEQQAAVRVFLELVQTGENTEDTRRRAALQEMGEETRDLVKKLADARLVVTGRDEATGQETVEVAHEALIQHWHRLQGWLNADREFLLWRQRLRHDLEDWQRTGRDEGALLRGASLAEAERWLTGRAGTPDAGGAGVYPGRPGPPGAGAAGPASASSGAGSWPCLPGCWLPWCSWPWPAGSGGGREGQRQVALSRQLAAQALHLQESSFDLSLLLSVAATSGRHSGGQKQSAGRVVHQPHMVSFLQGSQGTRFRKVGKVAFSPNGRLPGICHLAMTPSDSVGDGQFPAAWKARVIAPGESSTCGLQPEQQLLASAAPTIPSGSGRLRQPRHRDPLSPGSTGSVS